MLNKFIVGKWHAAAELIIWPSWMMPTSAEHIASKCALSSLLTKITLPVHSFSFKNSLIYFSPSLPLCKLITVTKLSNGRALALNEVGAEYFSKNSLIPLRTVSDVNSASFFSLPGA
jgi:hypothetical protein